MDGESTATLAAVPARPHRLARALLLRWLPVLVLVGMLLWGRLAAANQDLEYRTLETEHFIIHYPVGTEEVADRVAMLAERAHARLTLLLAHEPRLRTHIIITDTSDASNGFANAVPFPRIRLFTAAPSNLSVLGSYDDWLDILVTHEFTHVVHIDTVHGLPKLLNAILGFGVLGKISGPNIVQPRWVIEGLATMYESDLSSQGRYRSALFEMFLRMAVLDGRFQQIDQFNSNARVFPHGTSVYLYGLHFMHYLGMHYGRDKLAELSHRYGSRIVPWGINRALKDVIGVDFDQAFEEFQQDSERRFFAQARQIRARGLRQGRRLTFTSASASSGQHTRYPVWSPDDRFIWFYEDDGQRQAGIRRVPAEGSRIREGLQIGNQGQSPDIQRMIDVEDASLPAFVGPNEDKIVFDLVATYDYRYRWSDLYMWKSPDRRGREQLTFGMRARTPDVSPDGRTVAFVRNDSGQSRIALLELDTKETRELAPLDLAQQSNDPDFHPGGHKIAYAAFIEGGFQDIWVYDLESETHERITADRALDSSPDWSADGRYLLFSSDRSGVNNVYAWDSETNRIRQVTNVLGGAFEPALSHDGKTLAYVGYSSMGFDIWSMEFDPEQFIDPMPGIPAWPTVDDATPELAEDEGRKPSLRSKRYGFWRTFFPRTLFPSAFEFESGSIFDTLGLTLQLEDVIGFHNATVTYEYLTDVNKSTGSFSYRFSRLFPDFQVGFGRSYRFRPGGYTRYVYDPLSGSLGDVPGQPYQIDGYLEQITAAEASMSLPVLRADRHNADVSVEYSFVNYRNLDERDDLVDPNAPASIKPEVGNVASVVLGFAYDNRESVRYGYGNETGRRLGFDLTLSDRRIGSDYDDLRISGSYAEYLRMPWPGHQVLALRLSGGASSGGLRRRGAFRLGGLSEDQDVIRTVLARSAMSDGGLRGYDPGIFGGQYFALFNAEYRIPLFDLDRGIGSVPGFFERLVVAVFTDWGMAWTDPLKWKDLAGSIGASLITRLRFGYGEGVSLFFQYAHGFQRENGIDYFRVFVGRSF